MKEIHGETTQRKWHTQECPHRTEQAGLPDSGAGCAMDRMSDHRRIRPRTCLEVGALAVPRIFGVAFTGGGEVLRVCSLIWRRGERIGARFVTARELRQGFEPAGGDTELKRALAD
jgi:hypothetical protein